MEWTRDGFLLTTNRPAGAVEATYELLQSTYWSHKRSPDVVSRILETSMCFYLLHDHRQAGFGRVITDLVTTSWIADVVLSDDCRARGLGSWMMECVLSHPDLRDTQFVLQTGTAQRFYERLGFVNSPALMSTPVDYLSHIQP